MTQGMKNVLRGFLLTFSATTLILAATLFIAAAPFLTAAPALAEDMPAPDVTPGPATIHGRVISKEDPTRGIAQAKVVLYALLSDGSPGLRKTVTDADGRFRFEAISNSPDITYLLGAEYKNIPFPGARIVFTPGELEREVPIAVTAPIKDGSQVTLNEMEIEVNWVGGEVTFTEFYLIDNKAIQAVSVDAADREGLRPPIWVELPDGARNFQMPYDVIPDGIVRKGNAVEFWGPIYSGPQDLSLTYQLPVISEAVDQPGKLSFHKKFPRALSQITLLIPVNGPTFQAVDGTAFIPSEASERGHFRFQTFKVLGIEAGTTLSFELLIPAPNLDPTALSIPEVTFFLELDEALLDVREQYTVSVSGDRSVSGTLETPLLNIPVPKGAKGIRVGTGGRELGLIPSEDWSNISVTGPIPPGETVLSLAYQLPRTTAIDAPFQFQREFGKHVPVFSALIADTYISADSNLLHPRKSVRLEDGRIHLYLEGFSIEPGEQVNIDITPLPARKAPSKIALVVTLVPLGFASLLFLMAPLKHKSPLGPEADAAIPSETRKERDLVISAIRDLEDDFDNGILSEEDYDSFRAELRAKAILLLQHEKEEEIASQAQAVEQQALAQQTKAALEPAPDCTQCGSTLKPSDLFCSQCGTASVAATRGDSPA